MRGSRKGRLVWRKIPAPSIGHVHAINHPQHLATPRRSQHKVRCDVLLPLSPPHAPRPLFCARCIWSHPCLADPGGPPRLPEIRRHVPQRSAGAERDRRTLAARRAAGRPPRIPRGALGVQELSMEQAQGDRSDRGIVAPASVLAGLNVQIK